VDPIQAIVLGIVQGLTEFIPVSSSGHLIIVPWLLGWKDPGLAFDAALHLGTLAAVLAYFFRDWLDLGRGFVLSITERTLSGPPNRRLGWFILAASIPAGIAGLALDQSVEDIFHDPSGGHSAAAMLLLAALILALAAVLLFAEAAARHTRPFADIGGRDALIIGCAQALAVLPGVSRSGATITAGLLLGLERPAAARFSFLLATPLVAAAGLKKLYDVAKVGLSPADQLGFALGLLAAAVSGYLCIALLLRYLQSRSTVPFVLYRVVLAAVIVLLALTR
jgi:undecaprenyl-diphosphatase